jgi:hypothetical protein
MMKNLGLPQCWRCIHPVVVIHKSGCGSQRKFASLEVATASAPTRAAGSTFMEFPPIDIDRQVAPHRCYELWTANIRRLQFYRSGASSSKSRVAQFLRERARRS